MTLRARASGPSMTRIHSHVFICRQSSQFFRKIPGKFFLTLGRMAVIRASSFGVSHRDPTPYARSVAEFA